MRRPALLAVLIALPLVFAAAPSTTPELRNPRTLCYSNQSSGWRMKKFRTTSSTSESAGSDDQSSK